MAVTPKKGLTQGRRHSTRNEGSELAPPPGVPPNVWAFLLKEPELSRALKTSADPSDLLVRTSANTCAFRFAHRDHTYSLVTVENTTLPSPSSMTPRRTKGAASMTLGVFASPMPCGGFALRSMDGLDKAKVVATMTIGDFKLTFAEGDASAVADVEVLSLADIRRIVKEQQLRHKWFDFHSVHHCRPETLTGKLKKPKNWEKVPPVPTENIKSHTVILTKEVMDHWLLKSQVETRSPQQIGVMKVSADDYLRAFGIHPGVPCEILHLEAYSFGGFDGIQPQVAENFVYGTAACNTWMMICEELARRLVNDDSCPDKQIKTEVKAPLIPGTHIAERIEYNIAWGEGFEHQIKFTLDALCTEAPVHCFVDRIMFFIEHEIQAGRTVDATFIQQHSRITPPAITLLTPTKRKNPDSAHAQEQEQPEPSPTTNRVLLF